MLDPNGSIGPLRIGMTEHEYFSVFTSKPKLFYRTKTSAQPTLSFSQELVQLEIDGEKRITKISVFRPREVFLSGIQLLNRPLSEVNSDLKQIGLNFTAVDAGLWDESARILLVEVDGVVDGVEFGGMVSKYSN